ncbi:MAG: hypothetical protein NUW00_02630 [Candidatus Kaiserbacteria bacterium]|nr:hypothetical protein [Candidatus Kaiserbacteria bacterium]
MKLTLERRILRLVGMFSPWLNHMLYRPYKGARRGYWYRLPWNKIQAEEYASL